MSKDRRHGYKREQIAQHKEVRTPKYKQRVVPIKKKALVEEQFVFEQFEELYKNNDESV